MESVDQSDSPLPVDESTQNLRETFDGVSRRYRDQLYVRHFRMLGRSVHLHTVGTRLHGHLVAAIAHLPAATAARAPRDLSVHAWDAEITGVSHPDKVLSGSPDDEETIDVSDDNQRVRRLCGQWAVELHRSRAEIVGCVRLGASRPLLHDLGKPLQTLIAVWARDLEIPLVHAGIVARSGNGILLGGAGGAGKSTTTLACTRQGFDFLGDDRVGLEAVDSGFTGHSVYNSVLVEHRQLEHFPELSSRSIAPVHPTRERKPLIFLNEIYPRRLPPSARIRAVALPRVAGGAETRVRAATRAEALRVIAPSSLILPLGPGVFGMRRLAALVSSVPCFWLDLGTDLDGVAPCIERVLDEVCK